MATLKNYMELKRKVEEAQQKVDKAEGALEQIMERIEKEFDCSTLEAAKKKLKSLIQQEDTTKKKFDEAIEEFEEKWGMEEE